MRGFVTLLILAGLIFVAAFTGHKAPAKMVSYPTDAAAAERLGDIISQCASRGSVIHTVAGDFECRPLTKS